MSTPRQLSLIPDSMTFAEGTSDPATTYGEIFTRRWVVDLILDLVGYTPDRDLASMVLVEPSCGTGAFLVPILDRLIKSVAEYGHDLNSLEGAIQAFDLLEENAELARKAVSIRLQDAGLTRGEANYLAHRWVTTADFLLYNHEPCSADFVVGNPPYIRLESVPGPVMDAYRRMCPTMRGRSDVYIGFIERGLDLLRLKGVLGYICADRWMRNQYGADLRELISSAFAVDTVITMHDADPFEEEVSAYPAIVVLKNDVQSRVNVVETSRAFGSDDAAKLAAWAQRPRRRAISGGPFEASRLDQWFTGRDLWPTGSPAQLALVADLEARFPPLEDVATSTRVGIGVATGADDVYITRDPDLVENDRLLPLLMSSDTGTGSAVWHGTYLVNPWDDDGLVDLDAYPRLRTYFEAHADALGRRHVAVKRPPHWYRTIDRVDPRLSRRSKLVLPDLKAAAHPVLDDTGCYPHHNLYYVVSDAWDLEVLGGLLLSDVANLMVGVYCVRMRGGCYRFQAQYLRRIRVPALDTIGKRDQRSLSRAFTARDVDAATAAAARVYGLSEVPPPR